METPQHPSSARTTCSTAPFREYRAGRIEAWSVGLLALPIALIVGFFVLLLESYGSSAGSLRPDVDTSVLWVVGQYVVFAAATFIVATLINRHHRARNARKNRPVS